MLQRLLAISVAILFSVYAHAEEEPKLADTTERLTVAEDKSIRLGVYDKGPSTASRDDRPFPRVLVIPKAVEDNFKTKPKATVRLLLKIVEGGNAGDSVHAASCIEALLISPESAAISVRGIDFKVWDDVNGKTATQTDREYARQGLIKLIAKKEQEAASKDKKK